MAEKRESSRSTQEYELVLSHADVVELMQDPDVGMDPEDDEQFYLFVRKPNESEINLNLRPLYENDKLVIRFYRVVDASVDTEFTDVDIS
jgi:hypothetical protein